MSHPTPDNDQFSRERYLAESDVVIEDLCRNAGAAATAALNSLEPTGARMAAHAVDNGGELEVRVRLGSPNHIRVLLFNQAGQSVEIGSTSCISARGH